ncbi:uncharacterized protein EV154DRAFT_497143 [Mucor mucedo]|uniref:uncharacterized protein n=1 Tax=Mucor mucedo TaxID=29922 RepID=UPI00221F3FF8|nr:uncharacterized protein EV154DRAFT_497143 [Mucor mucedo]KAI7894826.1 hypothetical protein EV154DRAFT_497143 [Mucor mucedo]
MELSTSPKTPKRQETLGPMTPIQDWEVERATVVVEAKSYREKAERLEKQLETDRQTYEKNTVSLLREVKLKESFLEKKLKDSEENLMEDLLKLQRQLDDEKTLRQEEIQTIRNQHELALESEDKKYQRRLTALQERLNAKDKEYAELFEKEKENNNPERDQEKDKLIESLNLEIAKEKSENAQLRESNSDLSATITDLTTLATTENEEQIQNVSKEFEQLRSYCKSIQHKLETSESNLNQYREHQKEYIQKVQDLENDLAAAKKLSQQQKKRLSQIVSNHDDNIKQLQENFAHEAQLSQMTTQAQFQNLQSEHTEMLRELREQHETEKEVWRIEQQSLIDEIRRDTTFEKEEAIRELTREWNDKNEDLSASMSKDAMEIQTHWESKLEEAKSKFVLQKTRLLGEIEVIKDRLGKEIHRRKQNQAALVDAQDKLDSVQLKLDVYHKKSADLLKQRTLIDKELSQLKSQNRISYRLARSLVAITSPTAIIDLRAQLPDILQTAIRDVSIMRIHGQTHHDYQNSTFDIDTIPTYGF